MIINSGNSWLEVCNNSNYGNIHCIPNVDSQEAAIGFYKFVNKSVNALGDCWFLGRNLYDDNSSKFSIACSALGSVFTVNTTGNVTIPFNLTVIGNITNNQITAINNEITNINNQILTLTTGL